MKLSFSIPSLMTLVLVAGLGFAGMRSGSDLWMRFVHTLVACILLVATIAARSRGAFWYGFAAAGWFYFLFGVGPWIGRARSNTPDEQPLNQMLMSSDLANYLCGYVDGFRPDGHRNDSTVMRSRNIQIICHSMLSIAFAYIGGVMALMFALAPRRTGPKA